MYPRSRRLLWLTACLLSTHGYPPAMSVG